MAFQRDKSLIDESPLTGNVVFQKIATHKFPKPYKPTLTFCIVKKRHHARLFPMNDKEADRSGNCFAGTVVDTVITHTTEFDFCKCMPFFVFVFRFARCASYPL